MKSARVMIWRALWRGIWGTLCEPSAREGLVRSFSRATRAWASTMAADCKFVRVGTNKGV